MNQPKNLLNQPSYAKNERDGKLFHKLNCITPSAQAAKARREHALKGDLSYADEEGHSDQKEGWVEDTRTVWHKVKSKEEFPQG